MFKSHFFGEPKLVGLIFPTLDLLNPVRVGFINIYFTALGPTYWTGSTIELYVILFQEVT